MINIICGRYHDGKDDDLILLPTIPLVFIVLCKNN